MQIQLLTKFGNTKTHLRLDLGFGDIVEAIDYPIKLSMAKNGPLFEGEITLRCYPKEFIFAEKLETVIYRGASNSRMKDFHDLYSLIKFGDLDTERVKAVAKMVFSHRRTPYDSLPITFSTEELAKLEPAWKLYARRLKAGDAIDLPVHLEEIIHEINSWLDSSVLQSK